MAKYRAKRYAEFLYGGQTTIPLSVNPMTALVRTPTEALVTWKIPTGDFTRIRLVRNQGGYPETFEDGAVVWEERATAGTVTRTSIIDGVENPEAIPFVAGRMLYYRMFLYTDAREWIVAGFANALVPKNYEFQEKLFGVLPRVFTSIEQTQLGELDTRVKVTLSGDTALDEGVIYDFNTFSDANSVLETGQTKAEGRYVNDLLNFLGGLGFTLDELVTYLNLVTTKHAAFDTPASLLPIQFSHLGLTPEPGLPVKNQKKLVRETNYLYTKRGTKEGLEGYIESLTGYIPKVKTSPNMLLTPQDSTFYKSTGNWEVPEQDVIEASTEVTPVPKDEFVSYPVVRFDENSNPYPSELAGQDLLFIDRIDDEYTCKITPNANVPEATTTTIAKVIIYANDVPTQTNTFDEASALLKTGLGLGTGTSVGELTGETNIPIGTYTYKKNLQENTYTVEYTSSVPTQDVSGLTAWVSNDDFGLPITLPFNIAIGNYAGNQISLLNNGGLALGQELYYYGWVPEPLSTYAYPLLWGLWYDIDTRGAGTVYYGTKTEDGRRYFQASWVDVGYFNSRTTNLTKFDLILYENDAISTGDIYGYMTLGEDDPIKKGVPVNEDMYLTLSAMFYVAPSGTVLQKFHEDDFHIGAKFFDKNGTFISQVETKATALRAAFDDGGGLLGALINPYGSEGKWNSIIHYVKAPAKASYMSLYFRYTRIKTYYVDTVSVTEGIPTGPYLSPNSQSFYSSVQYYEPSKVSIWLKPTEYNYLKKLNQPRWHIYLDGVYSESSEQWYGGRWYDYDLIRTNYLQTYDFSAWTMDTHYIYNENRFEVFEQSYLGDRFASPPPSMPAYPLEAINGPQISIEFSTTDFPEDLPLGSTSFKVTTVTNTNNWKVNSRHLLLLNGKLGAFYDSFWDMRYVINNLLEYGWLDAQGSTTFKEWALSELQDDYLTSTTYNAKETVEKNWPINNDTYYTLSFFAKGSVDFLSKLKVWGYDWVSVENYPLNIVDEWSGELGQYDPPLGGPSYVEEGTTNTLIADITTSVKASSEWTRYEVTFKIPSEQESGPIRLVYADFGFEADGLTPTGSEFLISGIVLEKGFKASEYFDEYAKYPSFEQKISRLAYTLDEWLPENCWWSIRSYEGALPFDRYHLNSYTYYDYAIKDPENTMKIDVWGNPWLDNFGFNFNNLSIE